MIVNEDEHEVRMTTMVIKHEENDDADSDDD